jgi:hypothetical protein
VPLRTLSSTHSVRGFKSCRRVVPRVPVGELAGDKNHKPVDIPVTNLYVPSLFSTVTCKIANPFPSMRS